MKTLERLRRQKEAALARMTELNGLAATDKRELSATEQVEYQTRKSEAEELSVSIKELESELTANPTQAAGAVTAAANDAVRLERERISGIAELAAPFVRRKEITSEAVEQLQKEGKTVAEAKAAIVDVLAKRSETDPISGSHSTAGAVSQDIRDKRVEAMSAVLLNRIDGAKYKLDGANEFRFMKPSEMAKECLERAGIKTRGMAPMEWATRALEVRQAFTMFGAVNSEHLAGAMSTSDFPYILANVSNKYMLDAYAEYPSRWQELARKRNATDFKTQYPTLVSAAESLELINEGGEYKYGRLKESRESYAVKTYGKAYMFTRQMLINDDMNVFQDMSFAQGRAAARTEADLFWALVTGNPNMADGVAVFHATHNNLIASGTVINVDNLGVARAKLRVQTGLAAEKLELTPKFLVVPVAKEQLALQYTSTAYQAFASSATATGVNPWAGMLTPIAEPRLDDSSATAWYIAAGPADHPSIVYAYLDGQEGVYQEARIGFNPDGMELKARIDFAAAWTSGRGWVKNPGA